jgi:hypothetical protein
VILPVDGDGIPNTALGTGNSGSGLGPTVNLQVTLSAPPARLPSVPLIVLPTIVFPIENSDASPSPFSSYETPSVVIDLPALPPLNFPTKLPPLQYFLDDDDFNNSTRNSTR